MSLLAFDLEHSAMNSELLHSSIYRWSVRWPLWSRTQSFVQDHVVEFDATHLGRPGPGISHESYSDAYDKVGLRLNSGYQTFKPQHNLNFESEV